MTLLLRLLVSEAGETVPGPLTTIGALIAGFTIMTGLVVWITRRLLEKNIPELESGFRLALDSITSTFKTSLEMAIRGFQEESKANRQHAETNSTRLESLFERKLIGEREFFAAQLDKLIAVFKQDRDVLINTVVMNQENIKQYLVAAASQPK